MEIDFTITDITLDYLSNFKSVPNMDYDRLISHEKWKVSSEDHDFATS